MLKSKGIFWWNIDNTVFSSISNPHWYISFCISFYTNIIDLFPASLNFVKALYICNTFTSGYDNTTESGSLPNCQSTTGTYDMSGNLWEWVQELCLDYPFMGVIQGGAYYCETCIDQDCIPCDPENEALIDSMHSCYYAGPAGWWCEFPAMARATFGFRCCGDPP